MEQTLPALVFGALLLLAGGLMMASQRRAWRQLQASEAPLADQRFQRRRIRRRSNVAGMILLIGVLIPVGDSLIPWKSKPGTFAVYWIIVLALAIWTILLALGDLAATRAQMMNELNQLHRRQLELRKLARTLKNEPGDRPGDH